MQQLRLRQNMFAIQSAIQELAGRSKRAINVSIGRQTHNISCWKSALVS